MNQTGTDTKPDSHTDKIHTDIDTHEMAWQPPGPGTWQFDAAHQQRPYPAAMLDWAEPAIAAGFKKGMAAVGMPLETMQVRSVHGWTYMRPIPVGGKDDDGPMPPKAVLAIAFRLVPELRRRLRTARSVFVDRPWNDAVKAWESTGRPRALARHAELAAVDLTSITDHELGNHLLAVNAAAADAFEVHFTHAMMGAAAVGRFAIRTHELTGTPIDRALTMLAGYSTGTSEPLEFLDRIVAALPDDAAHILSGDAATVLANIRRHPAAGEALDAYLHRFGDTIADGESPTDPTVRELPDVVVASVRARVAATPADPRATAERLASQVRSQVAAEHLDEWDRLLDDARRVTALRDDDVGVGLRLVGRSRLVLVEVGRRLADRGLIAHAESVFDIAAAEAHQLLTGVDAVTDADQRRDARLHAATLTPPPVLGPAEDPPDFGVFPRPVAELSEAVFAYIARLDHEPSEELHGIGIGTSPVTGTARIVRDVSDIAAVEPGDIIVASMTTPAYNAAIAAAAALVCDRGGSMSHAAIMAREFDIPAVVGAGTATTTIVDGATITVDPTTGSVLQTT